jgi:methylthioribose-1-phosphate isomerase
MLVNGKHYHTIWFSKDTPDQILFIDQRKLPFEFKIEKLKSVGEAYDAIQMMKVRGAPLIGVTGAWGIFLACLEFAKDPDFDAQIEKAAAYLTSSRPTAVNLEYAIRRSMDRVRRENNVELKQKAALQAAVELCAQELEACEKIGEQGLKIIEDLAEKKEGAPLNILTHCNAGWLACIDYGTATAPIYAAHDKGLNVHVWVDETRPRNQGARLTAWELRQHGVPHTIISDNNGGHLMQQGLVDLCIVGSDRTTAHGDVANKIGTYLKALAAKDNNIPFYVALPSSSIDFEIKDGLKEIMIEQRSSEELSIMEGERNGEVQEFLVVPEGSICRNDAFDVTPARLVTGLITERGICNATETGIKLMFPEKY